MEIIYNNIKVSGQFIKPQLVQNKPFVSLKGLDNNKKYSLIMYDPDAVGGNHIHWIVINIKGNNFNNSYETLVYSRPHPPRGSGFHNYIFSLYESNYDSNKKMNPNVRQINLNIILNKLNIESNPIYTTKFISKYLYNKTQSKKQNRYKNNKYTKTRRK